MTEWLIQLRGRDVDLQELSAVQASDWCVVKEDNNYYLRSEEFASLENHSLVRERAKHMLDVIRGCAKLQCGVFPSVDVQSIAKVCSDGRMDGEIGLEAGYEIKRNFDAHKIRDWANIAFKDEKAKEAFVYFSRDRNWFDLYKIFEAIEIDISINCQERGNKMYKCLGITKKEQGCFTRTANSALAIGYDARHSVSHSRDKSEPQPNNPMSLREAEQFIETLLQKWLCWKQEPVVQDKQ